MSFVFPSFLWGLLLLVVPIIIHLFNLKRAKKIMFSNVSTLKLIKNNSSSKLILKHYLVLFFRLLFVFFLVLAFSFPILKDSSKILENVITTIYLDNSYSNSNLYSAAETSFEKSISNISALVSYGENDKRYRLLTNESGRLSNRTPLTKKSFVDELSDVNLSSIDYEVSKLSKKVQSYGDRNRVYIFSDFQKKTVNLDEFSDSLTNYVFVPVAYGVNSNVFVDSVYLEDANVKESRNTLNIVFERSGSEVIEDLSVNLTVNGSQLSTNSIDLIDETQFKLSVDLGEVRDSILKCEINFEDYPITFDNRFYFVLEKAKPIRVLEIGRNRNSVFRALFDTEIFDFSFSIASNVDYSSFNSVDFIVLNEVNLSNLSLVREIDQFVAKGGTILIVPSESVQIASLVELLKVNVNTDIQSGLIIEKPDVRDPFFANVFDSDPNDAKMPRSNSFLSWQGGKPLLSFNNLRPYLSQFKVQKGNVFLLAGNLSGEENDFKENALFLPVMYNVAFISSKKSPFRSYTRVSDQFISVRLDGVNRDELFTLRQGDKNVIPEQRNIDGNLLLNIKDLDLNPGFWELLRGEEAIKLIALNYSITESIIDQYSKKELDEFVSGKDHITILDAESDITIKDSIEEMTGEKNLWKYSLILALLFFFAEVLTLRFL